MSQWSEEIHELVFDKVFLLLGLTSFLVITGVPLISPALPSISESLAVEQSQIGLVITAYTLPAIFILPFSGFLADNFGRRLVMSVGSLLIGLGGLVGFLSNSFTWLLAGRVVQGIGYAGVMPLTVTLIGDLYESNKENEAQGLRQAFIKVGGILWPVIGGLLAAISWNHVFLGYLLFIPLAVLLWYGVPRLTPDNEDVVDYMRSLTHIAEQPRITLYLSIGFVRFFMLYSFLTYLPLLLSSRFSVGSATVGSYIAALGVGGILSATSSGIFDEKFRKTSVIIASFFAIGVLALVIAAVDSLPVTIAAIALVGLFDALVGPLDQSLLTQNVEGEHRAGIVTLNSVLQNTGKTLAPLVIGSILFLDNLIWLYADVVLSFTSASVLLMARRQL